MEYFKFLPSVFKSLVQVRLPKMVCQSGMILYDPAKGDQINCTSIAYTYSICQKGMIHLVPLKLDKITCTSMYA